MKTFKTSQSIGEIVSIMPKASDIFKKYGIDFCCGGHHSLAEAIKEQNLDEGKLLGELDAAYEQTMELSERSDYRTMPLADLIDHIVATHHSYLKRMLPELSDLTTTILKVHGKNHPDLFRVHKLFHNLKMELDQHLIKEEEILFPMIKEYEADPSETLLKKISYVVRETEDEHEGAGDILKELRSVTEDYILPVDGCVTYGKTLKGLQELEGDLFQHIHLENNILFVRLGVEIS
jgi:regulator of cell morphogenesis and NO signaling